MEPNTNNMISTELIVYFIISLIGAAVGVTSLILRYQRLKSRNVVFRRKDFWFCNLFLLANPILIIILCDTGTYHRPAQTSAFLAVGFSLISIVNHISKTITFDSDGIHSRNIVFVKTFYPYSAIISKRVYQRRYTKRRHNRRYTRYVDFLDIRVKDEEKHEPKTISMIVDSYNYEEFMIMLDKKCPQLNHVNNVPFGNYNSVNFYGDNNY